MATPTNGQVYDEHLPGIEVAPQQPHAILAFQQPIGEKDVAGHAADYVSEVTQGNEAVGQPKRERKVLIIAVICAGVVIVVLVGVLAGVLTRRHPNQGKYRPSNATSSQDWYPRGSAFELVGGAVNSGSSVAVRSRTQGDNATDLYITGDDGKVYEKWHSNDQVWSGWGPIASPAAAVSAPAVVSYDELVDDVFVLAKGLRNSTIHNIRWANGVWGSYNDLGGSDMQFTPAAISWDGTRVDVFGVSLANNHLFHTYAGDGTTWATFNGGVSDFEDLGGFCTSSPVVVSRAKGFLDVFARGGDGGLWQLSYNGSWSPWTLISGKTTIQGQPDALSWDTNWIDVFAWGSDNSLLTKSFNAQTGQWTPNDGFDQIGTGLSGPPKSVSDAAGSVHVFAYGLYGDVVWKHWGISEGGKWPIGDFVVLGTPIF